MVAAIYLFDQLIISNIVCIGIGIGIAQRHGRVAVSFVVALAAVHLRLSPAASPYLSLLSGWEHDPGNWGTGELETGPAKVSFWLLASDFAKGLVSLFRREDEDRVVVLTADGGERDV